MMMQMLELSKKYTTEALRKIRAYFKTDEYKETLALEQNVHVQRDEALSKKNLGKDRVEPIDERRSKASKTMLEFLHKKAPVTLAQVGNANVGPLRNALKYLGQKMDLDFQHDAKTKADGTKIKKDDLVAEVQRAIGSATEDVREEVGQILKDKS